MPFFLFFGLNKTFLIQLRSGSSLGKVGNQTIFKAKELKDCSSRPPRLLVGPAAVPSFPIAQTFVTRSSHMVGFWEWESGGGVAQFDLGLFLVSFCPTADNNHHPPSCN